MPRYKRRRTKKSKSSMSFTQSKKQFNKQIAQHCAFQQKVAKKLHDEYALFIKHTDNQLKPNWKMDRYLKTHPSIMYKKLTIIDNKLSKILKE